MYYSSVAITNENLINVAALVTTDLEETSVVKITKNSLRVFLPIFIKQ